MPPRPLASARAVAALLGLAALTSCSSCSETETNKARDTVAEVLDRLERLDSICAADVQVIPVDNGRNLKFTPVLRNDREPTTGGLRLIMTVSWPGHDAATPAPYLQLPATTSYPAGASPVADPRASLTVEAQAGTAYIVTTRVWAPLYPAPAPESGDTRQCHTHQTEYHHGQ